MSGPITAGFILTEALLSLSVRAIEEARAMGREYDAVLAQLAEREAALTAAREGQRAARIERLAALAHEVERQQARVARLRSLAGDVPGLAATLPPEPAAVEAGADDAALAARLRELEAAALALETALAGASAGYAEQLRGVLAATTKAPTVDEVLALHVVQRQLRAHLPAADAQRLRATAARVLARLELAPGATLPSALEALARRIVLAPSVERAEALATELRRAVQLERDARAAQAADAAAATRLLAALPADAPAPLLLALEAVVAGTARLDAQLRKAAEDVLDEAAAASEQRATAAAATVLEESLRDLGYEVEDIEATLFADGGAVHFRRAGWDNYFVRLRVAPAERTVNFNVVRARGDEENAERRRQDALAEDRWCAEFPRLMATLAARGLALDVTRRLDAGAVPVQVVDAASLPKIAAAEPTRTEPAPRARRLP
ncbi:MAG: hypothetical protein IT516_06975 [Burkholderiales bacterium]|nr:hypothetical protein [Burkholderiales bacterium]